MQLIVLQYVHAGDPEAARPVEFQQHVPWLRSVGTPLGPLRLTLPLRRGVLRYADDRRCVDMAVGACDFFIGAVGACSVLQTVCIEKRELKCAGVGGDSNVPLGFVGTENLMMVAMADWMLAKSFG